MPLGGWWTRAWRELMSKEYLVPFLCSDGGRREREREREREKERERGRGGRDLETGETWTRKEVANAMCSSRICI